MPYRKCHITGLTILWAALLAAPAARAQGGAAAEVLFEQGRQAMAAGIFDTACEKFRASEKLDPAPGTTLNLAECELRRGRLATAWELFRAVSSKLPPGDPRRPVAERRLAELEPRLPRVTFRLRPGSPAATTVRLGTAELGAGSLGVMLPLDPGAHRAVVTAPGHGAQAFSLRLAEGQKLEIEVAPGPPLAPRPASEPDQETGLASFWLRHRASLLVGGGAVVLAAVGAGLGAATWSSYVDLGGSCVGTPAGCAEDDIDAVESQAVATNVLFGAAGVAAATAAVLFIFVEGSPPPADARAAAVRRAIALAPAPGGVALGVRY